MSAVEHEPTHVSLPPSTLPSTPWTVIERAMEKGVDAGTLERLVKMHEDWQSRRAKEAYASAMQACQSEMPSVLRTKENTSTKSKYAPLESVHEVVKPVYLRHGFSLSFGELPPAKEGQCNIFVDVCHTGGHVERRCLEGALDTTGFKGSSNKTEIQGKGSTVSYLRRYLTLMVFNITVENEDRDGMARQQMVGPDEIRVVNELIEECEAAGKPVNFDRFVRWLGVESLDLLTMHDFTKAVAELNRKRKAEAKPKEVKP